MNNQTLVIYDFKVLYEILTEIENYLNFNLIKINKLKELNSNSLENYLIISDKKKKDVEEQIIVNQLPIDINKLIENINIKFLKKKYSQQSEINLGNYKLNLNTRSMHKNETILNLTEREANILIFLNNSQKPVNISKLQTETYYTFCIFTKYRRCPCIISYLFKVHIIWYKSQSSLKLKPS